MAKISNKLFDIFRNLKSDAIPRSPRPVTETVTIDEENDDQNYENTYTTNTEAPEEIFIEPDELKKEKKSKDKKSKFKKTFFKPPKNNTGKESDDRRSSSSSNVNTQASGNVINIVNSPDFHWGNNFNYYLGPKANDTKKDVESDLEDDQNIPKCNLITSLMEATVKPEHEYIDYISKNLGKNWRSIFRSLGYTKGRIETVEIDEAKHGVSEARYKLLLDWTRNNDDSLGQLASRLWDQGEKQIVKELAVMYKKNKK